MYLLKDGVFMRWRSNPHPVSDFRDWNNGHRLELKPDFQRKEVWSPTAKIMLIDSILRDIPMPKIYLESVVRDEVTFRSVIDGQQRLSAIFSFLNNEFSLDAPFTGKQLGKFFRDFSEDERNKLLAYPIDTNEVINANEEEIRELYSRVNKYIVPLNRQELRRADYPGDYLNLSEDLSQHTFFDDSKVFTAVNRRRMADVEYVSELLAAMLAGPQNKKDTLDSFYIQYAVWDSDEKSKIQNGFEKVISDIELIFTSNFPINKTRFKQKSDFYSLLLAIHEFHRDGYVLSTKNIDHLHDDLEMLDREIAPHASMSLFSEYAIKCVSEANTLASRKWRRNFLYAFLYGTYVGQVFPEQVKLFTDIFLDIAFSDMCPTTNCPVCGREVDDQCIVTWSKEESTFQFSNCELLHRSCIQDSDKFIDTIPLVPVEANN